MKRTTVLGAVLTMLMALGMSSSNISHDYSVVCYESCMMMIHLQPADRPKPAPGAESDRARQPSRMRPGRLAPNNEQSKDRRGSFGGERPTIANMLEHVMAVANEIDPELANQLSTICEADPAAFEKIIRRQGRPFRSLVRLREQDPELFEVKVAEIKTDAEIYFVTEELKLHNLKDPSSQAQLMQLHGLVRAKTALSIRAQSLYISRMEQNLDARRSMLEDLTSRFDEIVQERVEQLLGKSREQKLEEAPVQD